MELTALPKGVSSDLVTLDELTLALSLHHLKRSGDQDRLGLDLVSAYAREGVLRLGPIRWAVHSYHRAERIVEDKVALGENLVFSDIAPLIHAPLGSPYFMDDSTARELVSTIVKEQPALVYLIADRNKEDSRHLSDTEDGRRLLRYMEECVDSRPEGRLALSLYALSWSRLGEDMRIHAVRDALRGIDPAELEGAAEKVARLRSAFAILDGETLLGGVTFRNFSVNVRDIGLRTSKLAPLADGRNLIRDVLAENPRLLQAVLTAGSDTVPY